MYTDLLRRVSELHGPESDEMIQALKDVDDVLQAKLIDVRSKEEGRGGGDGLKVRSGCPQQVLVGIILVKKNLKTTKKEF